MTQAADPRLGEASLQQQAEPSSQAPGDKPVAAPPPVSLPTFRSLSRGGNFTAIQVSGRLRSFEDFYHFVMTARWRVVLGILGLAYLVTNVLFALLYLAGGDVIANAERGSFSDAFFFSVQTMATIGYGLMAPKTVYAHVLVTLEALLGLLGVAMATGMVFAKFSRPQARVAFSEVAIIVPRNGIRHLVFRVANARTNEIVEASIKLVALKFEVTSEGERMRRFYDMALVRSTNPIFAMTWTVMHPIDEKSPLYGLSLDDMRTGTVEVLAILTGIDGTLSQTIHARFAYGADDILEGARFKDMIIDRPDGKRTVDLRRISEWVKVE